MTCQLINGARTWSGKQDRDGYREYTLVSLVQCASTDGPANAMQTPGLPEPGSQWTIDDDNDDWAFCKLDMDVQPQLKNEPNEFFEVTQTFSTKGDEKRCKDEPVDDPLLEPQKVSGSFQKYQEEATTDRFNFPITNSSHEQIRGPQNEWDANRLTIKVEQNVPDLQLLELYQAVDTLNDDVLWGLPARCWKLSAAPWERKFHGQCQVYYTRTLEFDSRIEVNPDTGEVTSGWDRDLLDEGTKVLRGRWDTDPDSPTFKEYLVADDLLDGSGLLLPGVVDNPANFIRFVDFYGNPAKTLLDGQGRPYNASVPGQVINADLLVVGDTLITVASSATPLLVAGMTVAGAGIADGTTIAGFGVVAGQVFLSTPYTIAGTAVPLTFAIDPGKPAKNHVEKYDESNFLLFGIPPIF